MTLTEPILSLSFTSFFEPHKSTIYSRPTNQFLMRQLSFVKDKRRQERKKEGFHRFHRGIRTKANLFIDHSLPAFFLCREDLPRRFQLRPANTDERQSIDPSGFHLLDRNERTRLARQEQRQFFSHFESRTR